MGVAPERAQKGAKMPKNNAARTFCLRVAVDLVASLVPPKNRKEAPQEATSSPTKPLRNSQEAQKSIPFPRLLPPWE